MHKLESRVAKLENEIAGHDDHLTVILKSFDDGDLYGYEAGSRITGDISETIRRKGESDEAMLQRAKAERLGALPVSAHRQVIVLTELRR